MLHCPARQMQHFTVSVIAMAALCTLVAANLILFILLAPARMNGIAFVGMNTGWIFSRPLHI